MKKNITQTNNLYHYSNCHAICNKAKVLTTSLNANVGHENAL
jgi:hypothetical protein